LVSTPTLVTEIRGATPNTPMRNGAVSTGSTGGACWANAGFKVSTAKRPASTSARDIKVRGWILSGIGRGLPWSVAILAFEQTFGL